MVITGKERGSRINTNDFTSMIIINVQEIHDSSGQQYNTMLCKINYNSKPTKTQFNRQSTLTLCVLVLHPTLSKFISSNASGNNSGTKSLFNFIKNRLFPVYFTITIDLHLQKHTHHL